MKKIDVNNIPALSGLRFFAFLAIMLEHSGLTVGAGMWAVSLFVLLSGFCMTINHLNDNNINSISSFNIVKRKFKKIYPLHVLMIILAFPIAINNSYAISSSWNIFDWITKVALDLALLSSWVPIYKYWSAINIPSWYLGVYIFSILMFKPILKVVQKISNSMRKCIGLALGIYVFQALLFALWGIHDKSINLVWFTYRFPLMRILDFGIGCLLGAIYLNCKNKIGFKAWQTSFLQILLLFCVICMCKFYKPLFSPDSFFQCWIRTTWFIIPNALIILSVCSNDSLMNIVLSSDVFVSLGNLVVYAFLIHHVVIDYFLGFLQGLWAIMITSFVISLTLAWIYKKLWEIREIKRG